MKHLTVLFTLIVAISTFLSCGDKSRYAEPLLSAEQTARTKPYDAIVVLEGRKDSLCHTEADSALYELVYAEALRGLGLQTLNAEYVSRSADFFSLQGDDDRTARALLQTALCYFDDGKYVDAVKKMKEAEAIAVSLSDHDLHNRLFLALAQINDLAGNDSTSNHYCKLALTAAQHLKDPNRTAMTLNAAAEHHLRQGDNNAFKTCMSLCEPLTHSITDINRAAIDANMGCYNVAKGDTAAAKTIFRSSQFLCPDRKSSLYLADIYAKEGDMKMAETLWYDATNSNDVYIRKAALGHLIASAKARGNMKEELFLSNMLNDTYEKDITKTTATAIVNIQTDYDSQRTTRHDNTATLLFVGVCVSFVGAGVAIFIVIMRRHERRKEASLKRWNMENVLMQADCVHRLHRLAATGKTAQKTDWDDLRELVSQHDKPIAMLLERNKNLSATEINIVMLTRLRFLPNEIATLTASSSQSATNTRARLLRKIFGREGGAKDFDHAIREI